jgi:transcription antitermination factor NusG
LTADSWLIVRTEPNRERIAAQFLKAPWTGRTVYLPLVVVTRLMRSKLVKLVRPLFPRYLFVADDAYYCRSQFRSVPGVAGLVTVAGCAAHIRQVTIDAIESRCREFNQHGSLFRAGEQVRTASGLDAIFLEDDGQARARLLIQLFAREIDTWVPIHSLRTADGVAA